MRMLKGGMCAVIICAGLLFITGCAQKTYMHSGAPVISKVAGENYSIRVEPKKLERSRFFSYFTLTVENQSNQPIEIDWNKSLFVYNGQAEGGFYFQTVTPADIREKTVPNSVIEANSDFSLDIAPVSRVAVTKKRQQQVLKGTSLYPGLLSEGKNTVRLSISHDGKTETQRLTVEISEDVVTN